MKITFVFNDTIEIVLQPENSRDSQYLKLAFGEKPIVQIGPSKDDSIRLVLSLKLDNKVSTTEDYCPATVNHMHQFKFINSKSVCEECNYVHVIKIEDNQIINFSGDYCPNTKNHMHELISTPYEYACEFCNYKKMI